MTPKSFIASIITLCTLSVSAQSLSHVDTELDSAMRSNKVIFVDGRPGTDSEKAADVDSIRRVISTFYYDQFRHFQDPGAPYFLFMSKDSGLAMGIGGAVRMRGYYGWNGAIPSTAFVPYLIPMTPVVAERRHIGSTPAGTCLYFRVLGQNKALGEYQLYIEANFNGYEKRGFHLKKAYAIINDFTVGYATSTFSDPAAEPPTVDAQGPNSKVAGTNVLIRYMHAFRERLYVAASVETPHVQIDATPDHTRALSPWLPDWAAFVQYQWAPGQHVRLAGILRTLSYRNLKTGTNHNALGRGLHLSAVAHPARPLTAYASIHYGRGIGTYNAELSCGNYDLVPDDDDPYRLYAPRSFGWLAGIQYNFRPDIFVSVTASQMRYLPDSPGAPDEYKYAFFGCANVFWNLTPRIMVGAEFDAGMRRNFSGEHRQAYRAGAVCQFAF